MNDEGTDAFHDIIERPGYPFGFDNSETYNLWTLDEGGELKIQTSEFRVSEGKWSQAITLSHIDKVENGSDEGGDNTHHNHHSNATLPSIAVEENGNATVVWQQSSLSGISHILVSRKETNGAGQSKFWSEPELLSSYNRHAFHPQVVIGKENNPVVVWAQEPVFPRYGGRVSDYAMHLEIAEWKYDVPEVYNVNQFMPTTVNWPVPINVDWDKTSYQKCR